MANSLTVYLSGSPTDSQVTQGPFKLKGDTEVTFNFDSVQETSFSSIKLIGDFGDGKKIKREYDIIRTYADSNETLEIARTGKISNVLRDIKHTYEPGDDAYFTNLTAAFIVTFSNLQTTKLYTKFTVAQDSFHTAIDKLDLIDTQFTGLTSNSIVAVFQNRFGQIINEVLVPVETTVIRTPSVPSVTSAQIYPYSGVPTSLSATHWWSATIANELVQTDGTSATDGASVSSWNDLITGVYNMTQPGAGKPVYQTDVRNSSAAVAFNGSNATIFNQDSFISYTQPYSILVVMHDLTGTKDGANTPYFDQADTALGTRVTGRRISTNQYNLHAGTNLNVPVSTTAPTANDPHIFIYTVNGTSSTIYIDSVSARGNAGTRSFRPMRVGADYLETEWLSGYIYEVAFWNRELTFSEITTLNNHYSSAYQINLSAQPTPADFETESFPLSGTPTSLSATYWWNAQRLGINDIKSQGAVVTGGGNVTMWRDRITGTYNLTDPDASTNQRPIWRDNIRNTYGAVHLNDSIDVLTRAASGNVGYTQPYTVVVTFQDLSGSAAGVIFNTSSGSDVLFDKSGGSYRINAGTTVTIPTSTAPVNTDPHIAIIEFNGANSKVYFDSVTATSEVNPGTRPIVPINIGNGTSSLSAHIFDVQFYDKVLSTDDISTIHRELSSTFLINLSAQPEPIVPPVTGADTYRTLSASNFWPLNESGTSTREDIIGNNDLLALASTSNYTNNLSAQALSLSGNFGGLYTYDDPTDSGDFTITLWARCQDFEESNQTLISHYHSGSLNRSWRVYNDGTLGIKLGYSDDGSTETTATANSAAMTEGAPQFYTLTYSSATSSLELQINRYYTRTVTTNLYSPGNNAPFTVGHLSGGTAQQWDGQIWDLAVFKRVLTNSELDTLWNGGLGHGIEDRYLRSPILSSGNLNYWLVMGQSNALSRLARAKLIEDQRLMPNSEVLYAADLDYSNGSPRKYTFQPLAAVTFDVDDPAGASQLGGGFSYEHAFFPAISGRYSDVMILKHASGGVTLSTDYNATLSGDAFLGAVTFFDNKLGELAGTNTLRGIVWNQGENDTTNITSALAYQENLEDFILDMRRRYGTLTTPFYIIATDAPAQPYNGTVRAAQAAVAESDTNVYLIDPLTISNVFRPDNIHWDGPSILRIGHQVGTVIAGANETPLPTETNAPSSLGAVHWYNATTPSIDLREDSDLSAPETGDPIEIWRDRITRTYNLKQTTQSLQPQYISNVRNLKGAVQFDGTNTISRALSGITRYNQPFTISIVYQDLSGTSEVTFFDSASTVNSGSASFNKYTTNYEVSAGTSRIIQTSAAPVDMNPHIAIIEFNGANTKVYMDSMTAYKGNAGANSIDFIRLGSDYNTSRFLSGYIYDVALFTGVLATTALTSLNDYYSGMYNINLSAQPIDNGDSEVFPLSGVPTDISATHWYTARYSSWDIRTTTGNPVTSGDNVTLWRDRITGNYNLTSPVLSSAPNWLANVRNEQGAVLFNGDTDNLTRALTGDTTYAQPYTVVITFQDLSGSSTSTIFQSSTSNDVKFQKVNNQYSVYCGNTVNIPTSSAPVNTDPHIAIIEFNGSSSKVYFDSITATDSVNFGSNPLTVLQLGSSASSLSGFIYDVQFYSRILSVSHLNTIHRDLSSTFLINLSTQPVEPTPPTPGGGSLSGIPPSGINTVFRWWSADHLSYNSTSAIATDGQVVTNWVDKVSGGNTSIATGTGPTALYNITALSGRKAIKFNNDTALRAGDGFLTQPVSFSVVFFDNSPGGGRFPYYLFDGRPGSSNRLAMLRNTTNRYIIFGGSGNTTGSPYLSATNSKPRVAIGVFNGTSSTLWIDRQFMISGNNPGSNSFSLLTMGARQDLGTTTMLSGYIADLALYDEALPLSAIYGLFEFYENEYGLTYETAAPGITSWPATWAPSAVQTNLTSWWSADHHALNVSGDPVTGQVAVGGAGSVDVWAAKWGGWTLTDGGASTRRPGMDIISTMNNRRALRFEDLQELTTAEGTTDPAPTTVTCVVIDAAQPGQVSYIFDSNNSTFRQTVLRNTPSGKWTIYAGGASVWEISASSLPAPDNTPHILVAQVDGTSSKIWIDGEPSLTGSVNIGSESMAGLTVGNQAGFFSDFGLSGNVADFAIFKNTRLTDGQRHRIENFYSEEYGITLPRHS